MTKVYEEETYYAFNGFAKKFVATAGVMNTCEEKSCYWVLDTLASYAHDIAKKAKDYMLVVEVVLNPKGGAVFSVTGESDEKPLIKQKFDYTDLTQNLKFWAINESSSDKYDPTQNTVVLLPEEY